MATSRLAWTVGLRAVGSAPLRPELQPGKAVPQDAEATATGIKIDGQEYPSRLLTTRQMQLFIRDDIEGAQLPPLPDHGFKYGITKEEVEDKSEAVQRAVSTRTASISEMRTFRRGALVDKFATKNHDTGANRVQVAVLTERIQALQRHISAHKHDKDALRQMQILLSRRRKVLEFMVKTDYNNYRVVLRELGLRPIPVFNSKYQPRGARTPHKEIHLRYSRIKSRTRRGHKGH
jgi:small subunit ribosomal protein S15